MNNWQTFWHMGGYAFYVWSAYGIAFIVLIINIILALKSKRDALQALQQQSDEAVVINNPVVQQVTVSQTCTPSENDN